ncbi:MAG: hypothetical protein JXA30_21960 [Deltaproteobacteria bacterium]|nr:hypothetical protein [Deltaproteobacteria bacterium]
MSWKSKNHGFLYVIAAFWIISCAAEVGFEESYPDSEMDISSIEEPLYLEYTKWPNNKIPVCWSDKSRKDFKDFDARSLKTKLVLNASWPAVANVEFTGWGICPSNTAGMVVINLTNDANGNATCGYRGSTATHTVNLGINDPYFYDYQIAHEFGHIMGFSHEMRRADFNDDSVKPCMETNGTSTNYLGTPANDRDSMMASSYCNWNSLLSKWDVVGVKNVAAYGPREDRVIVVGTSVYAIKLSNGNLYKYSSGTRWTKIVGGPGAKLTTVGGTLYKLTTSLDMILAYNTATSQWIQVGNAARDIFPCGSALCSTGFDNGLVYKYSGSGYSWTKISTVPAAMYASTKTSLYRLSVGRNQVEKYSGSGTAWNVIGGAANQIFANAMNVFATNSDDGRIFRYLDSGLSWEFIGGEGRTFVGWGNSLIGLRPDRSAVVKWSGSGDKWTGIGGSTGWIYANINTPSSLYATNPNTNAIYKYSGSGSKWTHLGQP